MQSQEDTAAGAFCAAGTLNGAVLHSEGSDSAKTGRERSLGAGCMLVSCVRYAGTPNILGCARYRYTTARVLHATYCLLIFAVLPITPI